jgi:hypothetical protein
VFTPKEARGANGVMLVELKGIARLKEMFNVLDHGSREDICFFPMGFPVNDTNAHA